MNDDDNNKDDDITNVNNKNDNIITNDVNSSE